MTLKNSKLRPWTGVGVCSLCWRCHRKFRKKNSGAPLPNPDPPLSTDQTMLKKTVFLKGVIGNETQNLNARLQVVDFLYYISTITLEYLHKARTKKSFHYLCTY